MPLWNRFTSNLSSGRDYSLGSYSCGSVQSIFLSARLYLDFLDSFLRSKGIPRLSRSESAKMDTLKMSKVDCITCMDETKQQESQLLTYETLFLLIPLQTAAMSNEAFFLVIAI